jgi:hypothetical protein
VAFTGCVMTERYYFADEKCECDMPSHKHGGNCGDRLVLDKLDKNAPGGRIAHHFVPRPVGVDDSINNCRVYCWPCHEKTWGILKRKRAPRS